MKEEKNKLLGVSWLKFFCFWRPWLSLAATITMVLNIIEYEEYKILYLSNYWGYLLLGISLVSTILLIILFSMAKGKDSRTINFISVVLMLEVVGFSYSSAVQTAETNSDFILSWIILCAIFYFAWYKTNMKYFNKRKFWFNITSDSVDEEHEEKFICDECGAMVSETENVCPNCGVIFEDNESIEEISEEDEKNIINVFFECSICGARVKENDTKCPNCGGIFDEDEDIEKISEEEDNNNNNNNSLLEAEKNVVKKENFDVKYDNLIKLKKLYDDKILTKEEFEHEKSIILESNE